MKKQRKRGNKKKKQGKKAIYLLLRYLILLGLMFTLSLIYKILTPLTVYSTAGLLKIFYQVSIYKEFIAVSNITMQIIPACVAGSAYLLLLILNLTVPMEPKQRVYSMLFSTISLFVTNILRIFILTVLLINNFQFFDFTHKLFWYGLSTVFVVGIWFFTTFLFKIKEIPVYTDIKYLINNINGGKKK